ncbi:MAG: hypothetical protein JWO12_3114 [Frankiales bacterium]|nr:hypothetical protein [Frankiales bacterium]
MTDAVLVSRRPWDEVVHRHWQHLPQHLLIGASVLSVLLASALGDPLLLAPLAAVAGVIVLFRWPVAVVMVWIYLAAMGTGPNRQHALHIAFAQLTPQEIAGYSLLAFGLVRWMVVRSGKRHALNALLGAFALSVVLGTVQGLAHGAALSDVLAEVKEVLLYLLPLPLALEFSSRNRLRWLEIGVVGASAVLTADTLARVATGTYDAATTQVTTLGETVDVNRIRPELINLVVLAIFLVLARVREPGGRWWRIPVLGLFVTLILLSYTRSTWVAIVAGLVVSAVVVSRRGAIIKVAAGALALGALAVPLQSAALAGHLGAQPQAIALRVSSIGSSDIEEELSYLDRVDENEHARAAIRSSPFVGLGIDVSYGATFRAHDPLTGKTGYTDKQFIHNQFYRVWLWFGLPGVLAVVGICAWVALSVLRLRTSPDEEARVMGIAAAGGLLALGLQAFYQTSLPKPAVIAATVAALLLIRGWTELAEGSRDS